MFESVQKRAAIITRDGLKVRRLVVSCKKLLSERGEAAGVSLAKITLDLYRELDDKEKARFFAALLAEFSPDPTRVLAAANAYAAEPSAVQSVAAQRRRGTSAPGAAPAAEPGARRHGDDPAHARVAAGVEARADRARRRRLGYASPAVVVVQPRLPADRSRGLAHASLSAGADHRARGGARDSRVERSAPAAGGRRAMLCLLPPRPARRAADFPGGGSDGPDGGLGAALAGCAIHVQRSQQGHHCRFLFDQQLSARLARHFPRQLPDQERGRCAVEGVPAAQGVLHAVAHSRLRRLARLAAEGRATPSNPTRWRRR